jgi:hypothetical protein
MEQLCSLGFWINHSFAQPIPAAVLSLLAGDTVSRIFLKRYSNFTARIDAGDTARIEVMDFFENIVVFTEVFDTDLIERLTRIIDKSFLLNVFSSGYRLVPHFIQE